MSSFIEMRDGRWVNRNCIVCIHIDRDLDLRLPRVCIRTNGGSSVGELPFILGYSFDTIELAEAEVMRIIGKELDARLHEV